MIDLDEIQWHPAKGFDGPWMVFHRTKQFTARVVGAEFVKGKTTFPVEGRYVRRLAAAYGRDCAFAIRVTDAGEPMLEESAPMFIGSDPEMPDILRAHGYPIWARMVEDIASDWGKPLEEMTIRELKDIARHMRIQGYSYKPKAWLLEKIHDALEDARKQYEAQRLAADEPKEELDEETTDPETPMAKAASAEIEIEIE